jgi:transcriptional regulator with XRE-family HTH domain
VFYEQYYKLCKTQNVSPSRVALGLNISKTSVTRWKNGAIPNAEILQKIATYFNVSTDYLLGNESFFSISNDIQHDEIISALLNELKDLDDETKKEILDYAKFKNQNNK